MIAAVKASYFVHVNSDLSLRGVHLEWEIRHRLRAKEKQSIQNDCFRVELLATPARVRPAFDPDRQLAWTSRLASFAQTQCHCPDQYSGAQRPSSWN